MCNCRLINGKYCLEVNCPIYKCTCHISEAYRDLAGIDYKPFIDPDCPIHAKIMKPNDPVNNPSHYNQGKIEVIDFLMDQKLSYLAGNVVKYICRAPHKGKELEDLKKGRWYLDRLIKEKGGIK